jgi:uncharacterized protein YukJ
MNAGPRRRRGAERGARDGQGRGTNMPLHGYGLLIGKIIASRPQRRGHPHWLLMVQSAEPHHPPYRVAVNLQSTERGKPAELQYQIVDFERHATPAGAELIRTLQRLGRRGMRSFTLADGSRAIPRLDFVRGGVVNPAKFVDLPEGSDPLHDAFAKALTNAAAAEEKAQALVAVFGTGYPIDPRSGLSVPTGFTGINNLHMNQGALNLINGAPHYRENGPDQDGGLIFLLPSGAKGFFVKFRSQTTSTDADGNPTVTGIKELDAVSLAIRKRIMPRYRPPAMAARMGHGRSRRSRGAAAPTRVADNAPYPPATINPNANPKGYLFADFDPQDASGAYLPDQDNMYKTPFVTSRSRLTLRGPVPTPRAYPVMQLASVVGDQPPGYTSDAAGEQIAFDVVGDSGAPKEANLERYELKVTDLMSRDAQTSPPAFLFHVGDVVYYYGEENYYYSQFYDPFRAYPAPIFAIPGNHDAITYDDQMVSLESFQQAFCATEPGRWEGSGGIMRSTMTQPGVYFTLDAPLVSIIGLYSNWGESLGWLDEQQLLFLYKELTRLKALRRNGLPAVILAIHHFPRWFPGQKDPNSTAIDAACKRAGFWPDAVICGHAHLYQRVVRQSTGQDIPYVMAGAGGYGIQANEEVGKPYMAKLGANSPLGRVITKAGYVRATVASPARGDPTLRFDYHSVQPTSSGPDDSCTINLRTNRLA